MSSPSCPSNPPLHCGERIGLTFIAQSASLSFTAVVCLLAYVSYSAFKHRRTPGWRLIKNHLDLYLLGLLFSDLIQSIGGIMDIEWVVRAKVYEGKFCTVQGVLKQFGDVGVALYSSAIAIHTFAGLVLRWREPRSFIIPVAVLCIYTVFLTLIIGIGYAIHHRNGGYYGPTTYWCWIVPQHLREGIGLQYSFFWVAALITIITYVPVFLVLAKIIIVEPSERWWRYSVRRSTPEERKVPQTYHDAVKPRRMLFYPMVYTVTVLPIAVTRISKLNNPCQNVPVPATIFSAVLFSASGLFNVIIYTSTRPGLLRQPATIRESTRRSRHPSNTPQFLWSDADATNTEFAGIDLSEQQSHDVPNGTGHA